MVIVASHALRRGSAVTPGHSLPLVHRYPPFPEAAKSLNLVQHTYPVPFPRHSAQENEAAALRPILVV